MKTVETRNQIIAMLFQNMEHTPAKETLELIDNYASQFTPDRERVIEELRGFNPYPESVFIPISDDKMDAIVKLLRDNGYSSDCLFGNWGRYVWEQCCKKAESIADELSLPREEKESVFPDDFIDELSTEEKKDCIIKGGWECPRCGQMNAIWKSVCDCPPRIITSTTI